MQVKCSVPATSYTCMRPKDLLQYIPFPYSCMLIDQTPIASSQAPNILEYYRAGKKILHTILSKNYYHAWIIAKLFGPSHRYSLAADSQFDQIQQLLGSPILKSTSPLSNFKDLICLGHLCLPAQNSLLPTMNRYQMAT